MIYFRYEGGRKSSQLYLSTCIPKYKTQPYKEFPDYYEERSYEREGPFFYLTGHKIPVSLVYAGCQNKTPYNDF